MAAVRKARPYSLRARLTRGSVAVAAKKPHRSLWQRALFALFVLVAIPMALAAALRTPAVREYVRQQAERAIRSELGLSAVISDVDLEPASMAIVARGITLDHPEHGRLVEAKLLRIRPSWWALLRGQIDLHSITIDKATVWLVVRDGKLINGPKTKPSQAGGQSVDLPFDKLWVKHSRLVVDALPDASGELSSINIYLDSTQRDVLGLTLSAPKGFVQHRAGRDVVKAIEVRAKLTDENVQVELLRLATPQVAVTLRHASCELPVGNTYNGELDLHAQLPQLQRWPLPFKLPHVEGDLRVHVSARSDDTGLRGDAKIALHRVLLEQYGFGEDVELALTLDKKVIRFDGNAEVIRGGGSVDLSGSIGLDGRLPFALKARVNDVDFSKLMEQLGVSPDAIVGWNLGGGFELRGTLDPLDLSGPLRMPTRDFRVMRGAWHDTPTPRNIIGVASANLVGSVAVKPRGIFLQNIEVAMRNSHLHVHEVLLGFDNELRVSADTDDLDLVDVTPLVDFSLAGKGGFELHVDGKFNEPAVGGKMHFAQFAFHSYPFGDLESDFHLEKEAQAVRFPHLVAKKGESRYHADDFVLDFSDHRLAIDAALHCDKFALQDFYDLFHYQEDDRYTAYQGVVTGDAQIRYTMDFPGDSPRGTMKVDMDLGIAEAELSGFRFPSGHFTGSWNWLDHAQGYRGGELTVERFALHKGKGTVSLSGKMALGGDLSMVAVGDKIAVRDTEGLSERIPELSGNYSITGTIRGTAAVPRAELELAGTGLAYAHEPLGDARAYMRLTDKEDPWVKEALSWKADAPPDNAACAHAREGLARGSWPADPPMHTAEGLLPSLDAPMAYLVCGEAFGGRIAFDMAIGRTRAYPLRGDLQFTAFQFGKLLPRHKKTEPPQGTLTGIVRLRGGALLTPSTLAGSLHLDTLKVGQLGVTLQNDGPLLASFSEGRFDIERGEFVGPSSALHVKGGGSLEGGLGLELSGAVDLAILPSFSRELVEASGRLALECKISGQLDHPGVFGQAHVQDASLRFASMPFPIQNAQGQVTFSAQRVIFDSFSAQALGGRLSLTGAAALNGRRLGSMRFEIEGDRLAFSPREGIDLSLGGQTVLAWKEGDRVPKLSGTLRLDRMRYTRPINMGRTISDMAKKERTDVQSYDPDADMLALDLRIVETEPMHVENNLIDADITIDDQKELFRLVGTDQRFGLLGNMNIRRGKVRLRDRSFDIKEGEISFASAVRIQPSFDVRAVTDVRRSGQLGQTSWHIGVHAWGTPESFQFALTSDPYLSEDDIALLLAVGMTHTELAQLQTSDLTGTAALEALATVTGVEREVQRAIPAIDDVHIASSYSLRTNRTEPQLHLGKRLADRVRLDAATGLAQSRDFSTGVEYQISDKTSVGAVYNNQTSTSASQLGDVGVDLKWRLEFD